MATLYLKTAGGNWTAAATWSNVNAAGLDSSGPPLAGDDCIAELLSGNVTIDAGAVCRSFNCTSGTGNYTGTITHTAGVTLTIGDATAGAGNFALVLSAGCTYTLGNAATSAITFVSTSATVQDINFDSKATGNVVYNATANGSWRLVSAHSTASTALVTLTKGSLNINGQTCSWGGFLSTAANVRVFTLGAADISINSTLNWNISTTTLTFSGASATLRMTAININFTGGGLTYGTLIYNNPGTSGSQLSGANTFTTLTVTGTAIKTDLLVINNNQTVTGAINWNGNSVTNRLWISGSTTAAIGTARTITNAGATMNWSNVDIRDITLGTAFDASAITGLSGDCLGNTNITFTTPVTQTATGTAGFTWSTHGWTTRVPLPQDDVVINNAFVAAQTVISDMPRSGKSISFLGCTGSPTWAWSVSRTMYGSLNTKGVGTHTSSGFTFTFEGRGAFTWTTGAVSYTGTFIIQQVGGSMTLQDNLILSGSQGSLTINNGTFNANNFNVTVSRILSITGTNVRALTMGTGTWTLSSSSGGTIWNATTVTNLTLTSTGSTIIISDAGALAKTFIGGGLTYNNITINSGGAGSVDFTGSNTFNVFTIYGPKTVRFTAATTTTVSSFIAVGNASNIITISSITAAQHTLSDASGINSDDYLNLTNSNAIGGATWYAGSHSTDSGGNAGWIFAQGPSSFFPGQTGQLLLLGVGQ